MVFFVISRQGFESYLGTAKSCPASVWFSSGILSNSELDDHLIKDFNITVFDYTIDPSESAVIQGAIETIKLHHSNEVIWFHR